uniref:AAA_12 domain-containing protein n=1 Tax=Globodera pallida TaxID=36090 RepID=A0A183BUP6_GLOPA
MLESSAFGLTVTVGAGEQQNDEKTPEGGRESVEIEQEGEAQPLESTSSITTGREKVVEETGKVKNKDLGPSVMCKKNGAEVGQVELEADEAESVFGNEGSAGSTGGSDHGRSGKAKKKNPTAFDVAVPGNELLQRLYPHQADPRLNLRSLTPGSLVRVTHVQIDRPDQIAIGPKELGENGIAAALSGCLLKAKAEAELFTINTKLFVLENRKNTLVVTFEHFEEVKRKFVNLAKVWEEDLAAKLMLSFQPARKHDTEADFDNIAEGLEASLVPGDSLRALENRMLLFEENLFSKMAKGDSSTSRIWSILFSQGVPTAAPQTSSEGQSSLTHPALERLEGGQKKTAELMLDANSRVVAQQAPPGSGKRFAEQIGTLIADRNVVVLDEAGQAPFTQFCATLSALPVIKKVLITGDRYQLAVNKQDIPEPLRQGFGLDTLNVDQAPAVDKTTLQTNYRSHRHIVECVEHMAYAPHGETLKPGPGDFRMLLDQMKLPVKDSPLLLINQSSPMEPEATSFSATNSGQTSTVMEFLEKLLGSFAGSVRVISLYAGQAAQIGKEIKARGMERAVISATADSMQGQEADVVVVATTVSRQQQWSDWQRENHWKNRKNEFWGDAQRVNVALSRGKHGLVVIGNLVELGESAIWSRFLSRALNFTVVTTPSVIECLTDSRCEYLREVLVDRTSNAGDAVAVVTFPHSAIPDPGSASDEVRDELEERADV